MKKFLLFIVVLIGIVFLLNEEYKVKHYSDSYDKTTSVDSKDQVIFVRGLGKYSQTDLEIVSKEITKMFGFKCEIIEPMKTDSSLYTVNGKLDGLICARSFDSNVKTVYVTNEYVMSHERIVCGASYIDGNFIIISNNFNDLRNTTLHEIAHTLGLDHCENKCILGEIELGDKNGYFCNDCKLKLNLK
jgi:hypothetical protein